MAMSSEFYRDISKVEKKIKGVTVRHIKAWSMLVGVAVISIVEVLILPDWGLIFVAFPTSIILGVYPVLLLQNQWNEKKRQIELRFLYQERHYYTGQIRRYSKDDFIQEKNVKETDII